MVTNGSARAAAAVTILLAACQPPTPPLPHLTIHPSAFSSPASLIHTHIIDSTCSSSRVLCQHIRKPTVVITCALPDHRTGAIVIDRTQIITAFILPHPSSANWHHCL